MDWMEVKIKITRVLLHLNCRCFLYYMPICLTFINPLLFFHSVNSSLLPLGYVSNSMYSKFAYKAKRSKLLLGLNTGII